MVCPVRHGVKFDYLQDGDKYVVTNQEEYYPECYGEDCPYYEYSYGGKCRLVEKEMEEDV